MRYAIQHKQTKTFLYEGEESGTFLIDDGKYGILTYKTKNYAEEFLKELDGIVLFDGGGTVEGEMTKDDFEVVEI